jgi:SWI/SNF-related matrix-associated actin-dependent regulator of chromatin subfamily A3
VIFLFERPHLSEAEEKAYNRLAMSCKRSVNAAINERPATHKNRAILTALLRLRIFCNTGLASIIEEEGAIEQFNPDEINSLLQKSGEAPVCVECGCDILPFDSNDILPQQVSRPPRRRLKCQVCIELGTTSNDDGNSLQGHPNSAYTVERQPILLPKEDSGYESAFNSFNRISTHATYPSKLKAVLCDILEHQFQEKR